MRNLLAPWRRRDTKFNGRLPMGLLVTDSVTKPQCRSDYGSAPDPLAAMRVQTDRADLLDTISLELQIPP